MINRNCDIAACISLTNQASSLQKGKRTHIKLKYNVRAAQTVSSFQATNESLSICQ